MERVATVRGDQPVYLAQLDDHWTWAGETPHWHGLFIAADAVDVPDKTIGHFAGMAVAQRCTWVPTWGPDCERVHDLFDDAYLAAEATGRKPDMLLSAWTPDETLAQAIWDFLNTWAPSEPDRVSGRSHPPLVAYVQQPWLFETRRFLRDPDELDRLVLRPA